MRDGYAQSNFKNLGSQGTSPTNSSILKTDPISPLAQFYEIKAFKMEQKEITKSKSKYEKVKQKNNFYYRSQIKDILETENSSASKENVL